MTNRMRGLLGAAVITTALAGLGLGLFACSPTDPKLPEFQVGVVEGRVTVDGQGYACEIIAQATQDHLNNSMVYAQSDSSGWYRLEAPVGLYTVAPYLGSGSSSSHADSIRVSAQQTLKKDFPLSSCAVDILLPPELEGAEATLDLKGRFWSYSPPEYVHGGRLHFTFDALRAAAYQLRLDIDGCQRGRIPDPDYPGETRDSLRLTPDVPASTTLDFTSTFISLAGRVVGPRQGDDEFHIVAYNPDSLQIGDTRCSETGDFQFRFLDPRPLVLRIHQGNSWRWYGGQYCVSATRFDPEPGERITGIDIPTCAMNLNIRGPGERIFYSGDVVLQDEAGDRRSYSISGASPFFLGNLVPGRYFVQVNGFDNWAPWAAQWYADAESLGAATLVDLASGELLDLDFHLVEGAAVSGQVYYVDGLALREADVAIFDSDGRSLVHNFWFHEGWTTFPNGVFSFAGLPDGEFYLAAKLSDYDQTWYPGVKDFAEAEPVTINGHESIQGITWNLKNGGKERP